MGRVVDATPGCNPLTGLLCFQPDWDGNNPLVIDLRCNPLTGLLCFQRARGLQGYGTVGARCNPLTGLLCFQREHESAFAGIGKAELQSPNGASLFSTSSVLRAAGRRASCNPLTGLLCFQLKGGKMFKEYRTVVAIP